MVDSISGTHSKVRSGPALNASRKASTKTATLATSTTPAATREPRRTHRSRPRIAEDPSATSEVRVPSSLATASSPRSGNRARMRDSRRATVSCTGAASRRPNELTGLSVGAPDLPLGGYGDSVSSGRGGEANPDQIRGDSEVQLFWSGIPTSTSVAHAGSGSTFQMLYNNEVARLKIDTRSGYLSTGSGPRLDLDGFTVFTVRGYRGLRQVNFLGSNRDENVSLGWDSSTKVKQKVALGGGDDLLSIGLFAKKSRFSGGDGTDELVAGSRSRIDLDLAREKLAIGSGKKAVRTETNSFEDARLASSTVTLTGTRRSNDLEVNACRATVTGLGGRDEITAFINTPDGARVECGKARRMTFLGGPGKDILVGSAGRDVLVGGPGRDSADGRQSRDVCQAEETAELRGTSLTYALRTRL